ncbi:hypothetical protein BD410DRAFT_838118 [Rickenella mellea]|uniref:F-box domain-containing protein n=1 Tax=Rickenella mellea TaxID=50990 RepID=A0A4Y7QAA8_9AGAM|nr:hypothetical protein BD410DRAFT_838118 [Rickenella mellea]
MHVSENIPFEIWREIFQIVFATKSDISHPPSKWEWSPLNSRLNVYRCVALVSKVWRENARAVFFEDLQALTADALKGLIQCFHFDKHIATAVSRVEFSFYEFRCSMSTPRRPRKLLPPIPGEEEDEITRIRRNKEASYQPSKTTQAKHWDSWNSYIGFILKRCSSLAEVKISFSSDHSARDRPRTSMNYATLFKVPDLTIKNIIESLVSLENLREVTLIDPAPLEKYGPGMAAWERMQSLTIILHRSFEELSESSFIPPRSLKSFKFHDHSPGDIAWPLSSDLGRCTNLQYLNLGVSSLENQITVEAIAFLIRAYQNTLLELTLESVSSDRWHSRTAVEFSQVFARQPPVHFEKLRTLRFVGGYYDSSILVGVNNDALATLEFPRLDYRKHQVDETVWRKILCQRNLKGLKKLKIEKMESDVSEVVSKVCEELEIHFELSVKA